MNNVVEMLNLTITCDSCDYKEETVSEKMKDFVNKPCPKCGENLLTEEDYNSYLSLKFASDLVNQLFQGCDTSETLQIMQIACHGDEVIIKKIKDA